MVNTNIAYSNEDKVHWTDSITNRESVKVSLQKYRNNIQQEQIPTTPKRNTYSKQYVRQDWVVFTKDTIDWKSIDEIKKSIQSHKEEIAKAQSMLNSHKNMRF